jgi:hypothetical protein
MFARSLPVVLFALLGGPIGRTRAEVVTCMKSRHHNPTHCQFFRSPVRNTECSLARALALSGPIDRRHLGHRDRCDFSPNEFAI